ncbi:TonB-dependent receptor plug domain-containing protein [Novosphingobium sp.]|uniref:TonB-dependent receptor plug domain-containing protein n=1 Tax=Novosphingobium sp. TaxID=1874826 RepID=UPI0035ADD23A
MAATCPPPRDDVVLFDCPAPPQTDKLKVMSEPVAAVAVEHIYSVANRVPAEQIVVTASGWGDMIAQTGQSVSVIGAGELARVQGPDLTRVLERLPGVTWTRSGGLGSQTSLFVRGGNSEQLLVTIDGVRVEDQAAPSGGFDLGTLLSGGVGRVELLRGSNSVVWGSSAVSGVLAVTTAEMNGVSASAEYGANETWSGEAQAGIANESHALTLGGGYTESRGISAYALGTEPDGFRQWHVGGRGRIALANDWSLVAVGRYADSRIEFDGYPYPLYVFADTPEYQTTRQASGRAGFEHSGDDLLLRGGVALSSTRRAYYDPTYGSAPNYETDGRSVRADLGGRLMLPSDFTLDFGADSEWTRFSTSYDPRQTARLSSGHLQLGYISGDGSLSLAAGARFDDHDRFGSHWTFGANGAVEIGGGWRLRASYGEGFKAPTLYQLYGYGGNAGLQAETSRSFDGGIELGDRNSALHFGVTAFQRDARNLIDYLYPSGYFNVGRTRAQGLEIEGDARVTPHFAVHAAYTYVKSTNRATGKDLARRPRHALTVSADWETPLAGLALGADLRMVGDSYDDAWNTVPLDGYALVTLRAAVPVGEHFELYGRVENVADVRYQTVAGYGTYGRSAYAGVRVKW